MLIVANDNVSLSGNWTAVNNNCSLGSSCKIKKSDGIEKFDLGIGVFDAGEVYVAVMPHYNSPPQVNDIHGVAVVRGSSINIPLNRYASDVDNDSLHYEIDNSTTFGSAILDNHSSGLVTYAALANRTGRDNFTFRVTDNISLNPTRWAIAHIDLINPAPAYNVDNFTAQVDNGSRIMA